MTRYLAILVLLLGACATYEAQTPQQRLFALQSALVEAESQAAAYEARPRCPAVGLCSDTAVVEALRTSALAAEASLAAARVAPDSAAAAEALAAALRSLQAVLATEARQ